MIVHTTITYKRNGDTLGSESRTFRGRWLADAERKAMEYGEMSSLFPYASDLRILCEQPCGKTTSLCWLLGREPRPLSEKIFA